VSCSNRGAKIQRLLSSLFLRTALERQGDRTFVNDYSRKMFPNLQYLKPLADRLQTDRQSDRITLAIARPTTPVDMNELTNAQSVYVGTALHQSWPILVTPRSTACCSQEPVVQASSSRYSLWCLELTPSSCRHRTENGTTSDLVNRNSSVIARRACWHSGSRITLQTRGQSNLTKAASNQLNSDDV